MKQAEHCGRDCAGFELGDRCRLPRRRSSRSRAVSLTPTLNQTGELKQAFWVSIRCASSSRKFSPSCGGREVAVLLAPIGDGIDHALHQLAPRWSRARASPALPWKYLLATMLVAVCDQSTGTSTSRCSKITRTFVVADGSGAGFPLDFVVRGFAGFQAGGEITRECDPGLWFWVLLSSILLFWHSIRRLVVPCVAPSWFPA